MNYGKNFHARASIFLWLFKDDWGINLSIPLIFRIENAPQGLRTAGGKDKQDKVLKMSAGPLQYFREVKSEAKKVSWPSRKETTASTIAVFIMVFMASVFLYLSDQVLAYLVSLVLSIGA